MCGFFFVVGCNQSSLFVLEIWYLPIGANGKVYFCKSNDEQYLVKQIQIELLFIELNSGLQWDEMISKNCKYFRHRPNVFTSLLLESIFYSEKLCVCVGFYVHFGSFSILFYFFFQWDLFLVCFFLNIILLI